MPDGLEFPQAPAAGRWTKEEHEVAVAVYLAALAADDPDAGRMRSMLMLFGALGEGIGERIKI